MIVAVIVLAVLCLTLAGLVFWLMTRSRASTEPSVALMSEINKSMEVLRQGLQKQMNEQAGLTNRQMQAQHSQNMKIVQEVTRQLTGIERTNKSVSDVANELKSLQNVLQNPKQRGVLGEYYLDQILKNILPPGAYELQYKLGEGLVVDAVIKYGERLIPIDSKFSLENYNRLVEAKPEQRPALERAFKEDVKSRIDETAKYIRPTRGTLNQAFMFVPSEGIYYDLLANKVGEAGVRSRDLFQYAAGKKVTIVGPTTLAANLQVIVQGLQSMKINQDTEKIRRNIEQLGKHLIAHNGYMQRLGSSLGATVGHFNSTYKELGKIDKDVVKITGTDPSVEPAFLERPSLED